MLVSVGVPPTVQVTPGLVGAQGRPLGAAAAGPARRQAGRSGGRGRHDDSSDAGDSARWSPRVGDSSCRSRGIPWWQGRAVSGIASGHPAPRPLSPAIQVQQDDEAGQPLDDGADRRPVASTHQQVALPMPDEEPVAGVRRPIVDHPHVDQPASPPQVRVPPPAPEPPPPARSVVQLRRSPRPPTTHDRPRGALPNQTLTRLPIPKAL